MKKIILILLGIGLFMSVAQGEVKPVRILTSFYPVYIMAMNVTDGVPGVILENLTRPMTGCLHDYSATPDDMKRIAHADIFIANGLGMESFLDQAVKTNSRLAVVITTKGIKPFQDNAHVWVNVALAQTQVQNLADGLAKYDPVHAALYHKNADRYVAKLQKLETKMQQELAPFHGTAIITFHEAFPYFAQEFGLKIATVIEREPGSEPSARELVDTIKIIRNHKARAIFTEPQYSGTAANTIAAETHIPVYVLDPAVTGAYDKDAYLNIMRANLLTLKKALK
ncbi:MAG: metal ABC transporter substrate-binding protein [Candidatus Margulisbacteria bacterium]|nr:metal ABC transporter substrate-binding protein [Candidatus Margulisiibacteriota bacterium]